MTWVGLERRVHCRLDDSTNITFKVVRGNDPFTSEHKDVAGYCKVPPPVRRQELREIHLRTIEDNVDIGFIWSMIVFTKTGFELVTRFQHVSLHDTVVVLKVLSAALAGGTEDQYSWDQDEYMKRNYPKYPLSFLDYKKAIGQ